MSTRTNIEKQNLEAHVELCAERYDQLKGSVDTLNNRVTTMEGHLIEIKTSINAGNDSRQKQMLTAAVSVIGVLIAGIIGLVTHLLTK
jgi:phage shock protein A